MSSKNSLEKRWYSPEIKENQQKFTDIQENFKSLLASSINLRLRSDVPVGIFGGGLTQI